VLWPLVVLAGLGVYTSLVPLVPNDLWWHLRIGEIIDTQRSIPTTALFSWSLSSDVPFVYGAWLGEWLLYRVYALGGVPLLLVLRTVLVLATFWLTAVRARLRSGSWRLAALALGFAGVMSLNNLVLRPQIWSWLPFVVVLTLLDAWEAGRLATPWLLALPVIMVFWANAHGAFILGPVLVGIFWVGEVASKLIRADSRHSWSSLGLLAGAGTISAAATCANPQGIGVLRYVGKLMTDPPSQSLVTEWTPPTPVGVANTAFYLSILVLLVLLTLTDFKPTLTDTLLLAAFLWLAWNGQRYVVWFGLAVMPMVSEAASVPLRRYLTNQAGRSVFSTVIAVFLLAPLLVVLPWWVEAVPLPGTYWSRVLRDTDPGPLVDARTPVAATQYLTKRPGGRLFNEMGYGSYLIWALPEQGVFVDPRVELYPYQQWLDYARISGGVRSCELLDAYGADRVLLDRTLQAELSLALERCDAWTIEYEDDYSEIWTR